MASARLPVRVARKAVAALDVCTFELVSLDGSALPSFSAGAHVEVDIAGLGSRSYSLCNDPREAHRYLIAVLREGAGRGGSRAMHERVQVGDVLSIGPPRNNFALQHDAVRSVLVAGGIGITPLLCMAERLAHIGADFALHYLVRSRARAAFLDRIAQSGFAERVSLHVDDEQGGPADLAALVRGPAAGTHLYVCGPTLLMEALLGQARRAGWRDDRLHREYFAAAPVQPGAVGDAAFEVQIASSGRVIPVPADQTVIQALGANGIRIETSCEQGICGTCLTRVLDGVPDHRDLCLSHDEQAANDRFLPCCSRARTPRLVLDL